MIGRFAAIALATLATTATSWSAEIRLTNEKDFDVQLQGCWIKPEDENARTKLCFWANGTLYLSSWGGASEAELESIVNYSVSDDKLIFHLAGAGWPLGRREVACDAVVEPFVALHLLNCIGSGPDFDGQPKEPETLIDTDWLSEVADARASVKPIKAVVWERAMGQ